MNKFVVGEKFMFNYTSPSVLNGLLGKVTEVGHAGYQVEVITPGAHGGSRGGCPELCMKKLEADNE